MKSSIIRSSWLSKGGFRLDCSPYLGGALETEILLENLSVRKDALGQVTKAIFNGPKFSRTYVEDRQYGVPFLGGSSLQNTDLSDLPLLSKQQALGKHLRHLEIKRGMTLITCSGTIGKMAYARSEMEGIWASQHIMKVVHDEGKIPSGYLYAFLSSKFGIPLVLAGTYGSIIQSIEPHHIIGLPVPRFGDALEGAIHELVEESAGLRTEYNEEIASAVSMLSSTLGLPELVDNNVRGYGISIIKSSELNCRLDPLYHSRAARLAVEALGRSTASLHSLCEVTERLFKPPMFKRLWVNEGEFGRQFVSGIDAYNFEADEKRFVSIATPNFEEFIVQKGWVIFQAAGQIYGLFARPIFVSGWLEDIFVADDMYRIVPKTIEDGGYLCAFFRTDIGKILIKRQSSGNSIPRVWDPQMNQLMIPWPEKSIRDTIGRMMIAAHEKANRALHAEHRATTLIQEAIENHR